MSIAEDRPADRTQAPSAQRPLVPPNPPRAPDTMTAIGRMTAMRKSAIGTWAQRAYEEDIVRGSFFGRNSFIINTPDAIRHVLVDNYENYTRTPAGIRVLRPILGEGLLIAEGRAWKHQRRTLAPAFTPRAVGTLVPHMVAAIDQTVAQLRAKAAAPVDLREAMQRMALEIAGRTMFSLGMDRHGPTLRDFVMEYGDKLARPHFLDLALPLGWPTPKDFARRRFRRRWTRFVAMLMAERRADGKQQEGAPPRDLFDLMEAAPDPETGHAFTDEQLGDQVATMILAGHETTATALFWSLYLLALDPATQEKLAEEVRGVGDGPLDIERLKFTRAVIDETLRLYPPAFLVARAAAGPDSTTGLSIRKGDIILIAPWLLHRHEKLWHEPNAFIPSRFVPPAPDRYAYLPFGVGPRICIGAHFAITEATLALAKLIASFKVELLDKDPVMPVGIVTTQPDRSPMFAISPR